MGCMFFNHLKPNNTSDIYSVLNLTQSIYSVKYIIQCIHTLQLETKHITRAPDFVLSMHNKIYSYALYMPSLC